MRCFNSLLFMKINQVYRNKVSAYTNNTEY